MVPPEFLSFACYFIDKFVSSHNGEHHEGFWGLSLSLPQHGTERSGGNLESGGTLTLHCSGKSCLSFPKEPFNSTGVNGLQSALNDTHKNIIRDGGSNALLTNCTLFTLLE